MLGVVSEISDPENPLCLNNLTPKIADFLGAFFENRIPVVPQFVPKQGALG